MDKALVKEGPKSGKSLRRLDSMTLVCGDENKNGWWT